MKTDRSRTGIFGYMAEARLTIVSNRLPVTVSTRGGRSRMTPSSGGRAAGLRRTHARGSGSWIGWPGDTSVLLPEQLERLGAELVRQRLVPLELSADDVRHYYTGF